MKTPPFPTAIVVLSLAFSLPAPGKDPAEPTNESLVWTGKNGVTVRGRVIRRSGDTVFIERDGNEVPLSINGMDETSALQARELTDSGDSPRAVNPLKPVSIQMQPIVASRIPVGFMREQRLGNFQKKHQSGGFQMGSPADQPGREDTETEHAVWLKRDLLLKASEVTWEEWNAVRDRAASRGYTDLSPGTNGQGGDPNGNHPVLGITWWDAIKWCNVLSEIEKKDPVYYKNESFKPEDVLMIGTPKPFVNWEANGYRLPTEAEWEFACSPGTSRNAFHTGQIDKDLKPEDRTLGRAGWYDGNSSKSTHPVGGKEANNFGLHDMHGNAAEWCWDFFSKLSPAEAIDPRGPDAGEQRVIRGGSWSDPAKHCRAAYRGSRHPSAMPNPFVGFRPAMNLPTVEKR
ncbi:MAG: SUMF1/EgtB/PvdO family nonheme iron enzyme [Verrucomicrobiota bacterium]